MSRCSPVSPLVVLVVEDEFLIRMVAADMLMDEGFLVLEATTADEAWPLLESHSEIGVLFTDINMPGRMDGLTLASRVAERWPHIRLVVTSGRCGLSSDELPDNGRFVQKPYQHRDLVTAIAQAA
ncbi:response regulator [Methylobacterium komagatae]